MRTCVIASVFLVVCEWFLERKTECIEPMSGRISEVKLRGPTSCKLLSHCTANNNNRGYVWRPISDERKALIILFKALGLRNSTVSKLHAHLQSNAIDNAGQTLSLSHLTACPRTTLRK